MNTDEVVARWAAEESAVRARLMAPGAAPRTQVFGRTGMQVFEAIFAGDLPPAPIGETMDFLAIHIEHGAAVFQGRPQRRHYNPLDTVHGGWTPRCSTRPWAAPFTRPWPPARASPH